MSAFLIFGIPFLLYELILFLKPEWKYQALKEVTQIKKLKDGKLNEEKVSISLTYFLIFFIKYPYIIWSIAGFFVFQSPVAYLFLPLLIIVGLGDEIGEGILSTFNSDFLYLPYFRLLSLISLLIIGYPYYLFLTVPTF